MRLSPEGEAFIKGFETLRLKAYDDGVGVWTIGWGHTKNVKPGDTCTEEQAQQWFLEDLEPAEEAIDDFVDVVLTQGQHDALVSFVFNCGVGAFKSSTLLKLLNAKDFDAARGQFGRWNKGGGRVLDGLTKRRAAEAAMFA